MHLLKLFQSGRGRTAHRLRLGAVLSALLFVSLGLSACGKSVFFGGRALPPSGILNRVLLAVQNAGTGQLFLVDGLYDVRHNYSNTVPSFPITGFTGYPSTIQNLPGERLGLVFSISTGTLNQVNYETETASLALAAPTTNQVASSIFSSSNLQHIVAAQQQTHTIEVYDATTTPTTFQLNLPGVYRVSINQAGTVALAFVQNSDLVYTVVHLSAQQQQQAALLPPSQNGGRFFMGAEDCEPENLPQYCVFPVNAGSARFDRPTKAVFSPDSGSVYVVDCGPECGGAIAGVTQIPLPVSAFNTSATGPAAISLTATAFTPVPGGATNALFNGTTMYVAGQQQQPDGLYTGELSVLDTINGSVSAPIPISDGQHARMVLGDDNTLWIGSSNCQGGERYKQAQAGQNTPYGCMTMFNTATNTVTTIESYKGDGTGVAAVSGLHKVYTAEGGQVYIYKTTDGSSLDNANVTVQGTVVDVAYMDAPDDSDNSWY